MAGGGIGAGILLLRRPWLAWPALAVILPFASSIKFGHVSVTELALVGAVGLWFADGVRRRSLRVEPAPIPGLLAVYVLVLWLSALRANDLVEALAEVVKWAEVLATVWLIGGTLTARQSRWVVAGLLVGGGLQALLGIVQFVFQIGPPAFVLLGRFMRASGSFSQPNPFAGYLGLTLPAAVSLTLGSWPVLGDRRAVGFQRWLSPIFYGAAAGLIGLGILVSWSRGAWFGAIIGLGIVVVLRSRKALILSGLAILVVSIGLLLGGIRPELAPAPIVQRLADLPAYFGAGDVLNQPVTDENFAVVERVAHWVAALRMWERSPWLGVGPGNYAAAYLAVRIPPWDDPLGHAHNIYLNVLAETGLVGLAAYLLLWTGVIVWVWRGWRRSRRDSWNAALFLGILGILGHLTVHNIFDNLYVQGIYLHLALWLGAAAAAQGESAAESAAAGVGGRHSPPGDVENPAA
jgi:O-antigen ligase